MFRVARIMKVLRIFRQLREMLYSILACLASLAWAFLFLAVAIFMFSLVCIQGAEQVLDEMNAKDNVTPEDEVLRSEIDEWYGSLLTSMFTLMAAVTGGKDWVDVHNPIKKAGIMFNVAFVAYVLFVTIGVMNILTGVFLNSASEMVDYDLVVQNEQLRIESFVQQMIQIFEGICHDPRGRIDWPTFNKALLRDDMQAWLASMGLEPTHIHLVFELLDVDDSGSVNIDEFVMGLVKLKGEAKAIDARIIQREIFTIPKMLKHLQVHLNLPRFENDCKSIPGPRT